MPDTQRYAPDERLVVSTMLINATLAQNLSTSVAKRLERHRGFAQHQICVIADSASTTGDWDILFMPDNDEIKQNLSVDMGVNLTLSSTTSDFKTFTALLRGIVINQNSAGQTGKYLTFVISSTKGPLTTYL